MSGDLFGEPAPQVIRDQGPLWGQPLTQPRAAHTVEFQAAEWSWTLKLLVSGHRLGPWLQLGAGPGLGKAEGGNKETTGSSAFISAG